MRGGCTHFETGETQAPMTPTLLGRQRCRPDDRLKDITSLTLRVSASQEQAKPTAEPQLGDLQCSWAIRCRQKRPLWQHLRED